MVTYNPEKGFPRLFPSLWYEDPEAALRWAEGTCGFREVLRIYNDEGKLRHVDLELDGAYVMFELGEPGYRSQARDGVAHVMIVVFVDDVDAHYARARAAGATIVSEPRDKPYGVRQYITRDPEGHVWEFTQFLRDAPPEEWGAVVAAS